MSVLATVTAVAMSAVLLWAALEKARRPLTTAATIQRLGFPLPLPAALAVAAGEIVLAVALLFRPDSLVTQVGVVLLAGVFALAGLMALRLDEPIHCSCFGSGGGRYLGRRQLIAFVPWSAAAVSLHLGFVQPPSVESTAIIFAAVTLLMAAVRAAGTWRVRGEARGDRRSAQEMYVWLPSR
jgi:hypothetical protein